jgi:hypothetical protein
MLNFFAKNNRLDRIEAAIEAHSRDISHLVETVTITSNNVEGLIKVAQQTTADVQALAISVKALEAGQAQQQTVLNYLLRKEQERQNGL